jgi:uncharacterized membrane protein
MNDTSATSSTCYSRLASAVLAGFGVIISTYLAIYQYGVLTHVWEPLFGDGSERILNSGLLDPLSRALGIPLHDAALGAIAYGLEAGLALAGCRDGHARFDWSDKAYVGLVALMGVGSMVLVLLQAAVFHAWCTLCLTSAVISGAIVVLSTRELATAATVVMRHFKTNH